MQGFVFTLLVMTASNALARTRLENICTIYGQQEIKLTGTGLVIGLSKTGDGGKNAPAMRALASVMKLNNLPILTQQELLDADNVAVVAIEATIPRAGIRRGQKIDCYVSSLLGAKSLRGGRLLVTPVETAEVVNDIAVGLASGPVYIEGDGPLTNGKIPGGIVIEEDFYSLFIDKERGYVVTLMLDESHSNFNAASEVARVVNDEFEFETGGQQLARAAGPGIVDVYILEEYRETPVDFVARLLDIGIENPHTEAKVIVNVKTGVVIVSGEVEISPVVISHKNLTIEIGNDDENGGPPFTSIPRLDTEGQETSKQLSDLVDALNQLQVPKEDIPGILRELYRSGKLHATYEER
ncbi:MAG: flagellar basal body P-ring protein FlgI [Planctomycetaceae bacterium]